MSDPLAVAIAVTLGAAVLLLGAGQANPDRYAKLGYLGVLLLAAAMVLIGVAVAG